MVLVITKDLLGGREEVWKEEDQLLREHSDSMSGAESQDFKGIEDLSLLFDPEEPPFRSEITEEIGDFFEDMVDGGSRTDRLDEPRFKDVETIPSVGAVDEPILTTPDQEPLPSATTPDQEPLPSATTPDPEPLPNAADAQIPEPVFKVGDIVRLKIGGHRMLVSMPNPPDIWCKWHSTDGVPCCEFYAPAMLMQA